MMMPTRQQMEWMMRMGFIPPVGAQQKPQPFPAPISSINLQPTPPPVQMPASPIQITPSEAEDETAQAIAQEQAAQTQVGIGMAADAMMVFGDPITKGAGSVIKGLSGLFGGGK